jgi:hypothetical protein
MSRAKNVPEYMAKIPRHAFIRLAIFWLFRRYCLNAERYQVRRRFTGPRPKGTSQVSTIKANATAYRYYIETRPKFRRRVAYYLPEAQS